MRGLRMVPGCVAGGCLLLVLLACGPGLASARGPIDAVLDWGPKALFFMGPMVSVYDKARNTAEPGYPALIGQQYAPRGVRGWDGGFDATVDWGNGKAYFFKGGQYIRYDIRSDRADPGYPKRISQRTWPGLLR